jgi:transcription antitermination factor NusG
MLEDGTSTESSGLLWYVVRVRANAEMKVAQGLEGRGIEVFLPVRRRPRTRSVRPVERPLFPGYIFAHFDRHAALSVLMCTGVVHILGRGSVPEPVDPKEMYALQSVTRLARSVEALPTFTSGQKVRITGGPLADVEGVVIHDSGRKRLVVSISLLRRSVVAEIDREWIDHLESRIEIGRWAQIGTT